jgi:MoaA/NifB/PqqE/SkfB family radical SAM enzyme
MPEDALIEMPFLRNLGMLLTYRCQVSCPHCIIEAGPNRTEEMSLVDSLGWVKQTADYRSGYIKVLSLTGGEPFIRLDYLKRIADFGSHLGLIVSVVTNAYWATTRDEALRILRNLSNIRMLAISTDVYHQLSIPFERVKNAVQAARECDIPFNIHVCTENEEDEGYQRILEQLRGIGETDSINTAVTFPAGRALKRLDRSRYPLTTEPPISACAAGSSPIIFPDGRVIACIGAVIDLKNDHPLVLGNLRENTLQDILDRAETNPVLHSIRVWGPRKLIALIQEAGLGKYLPQNYIKDSVCNACYQLMASEKIVEYLSHLSQDAEFSRKVAYARIYYMRETRMAELFSLAV